MLTVLARILLAAALLGQAATAGASDPSDPSDPSVPGPVAAEGTPAPPGKDAPASPDAALAAPLYPPQPSAFQRSVAVGGSLVGSSARVDVGASCRLVFRQEDLFTSYSIDQVLGPRTIGLFGFGALRPAGRTVLVLTEGIAGFDAGGRGGVGFHPAAGGRVSLEWPVHRNRVDTLGVSLTAITDLTRGRDALGERPPVLTAWLTAALGFEFGH
jgi:hypothetical protein